MLLLLLLVLHLREVEDRTVGYITHKGGTGHNNIKQRAS